MNKSEFIRRIKELLELNYFKAVGVGAGAVSLVNETDKIKEEIIFSYTKIPDGFILPSYISAWKTFYSVNSILKKYFVDNGLGYQDFTIHVESRRFEEISSTSVFEHRDLERIKDSLKALVGEDISPFFSKYKTLEDVHSRIMELETDALASFITNPPHPRIMVIKRLVNSNDWESYCEKSIKIYKEQSKGKYKAVFEPIYRFLPDLYAELKSLDYNQ